MCVHFAMIIAVTFGGMMEVFPTIVRIWWYPDKLSVCLLLLSFPAPQNSIDGEQ